jgi:putative transposase
VPKGERKVIPYENTENRRVNAMAVLIQSGAESWLWWLARPRTFRSEDMLALIESIPHPNGELVVVLDGVGLHRSHTVQDERPLLDALGIRLFPLPAYSPELNAIEPWFGVVKHTEMPQRTYKTVPDLITAVNSAFERTEARLLQTQHQSRQAA